MILVLKTLLSTGLLVTLETGHNSSHFVSLYTASLFRVISNYFDTGFGYADDTQLIHSFRLHQCNNTEVDAFSLMQNCISAIRDWMVAHKLKLNDSKTEFIILGTPVQLTKVTCNSIKIGDDSVASCDQVRNLGFIVDKHMKVIS